MYTGTTLPVNCRIARKFGRELNLAVRAYNRQIIEVRQYFLHAYTCIHVHMAIPYQTAKFKSANIFAQADSR